MPIRGFSLALSVSVKARSAASVLKTGRWCMWGRLWWRTNPSRLERAALGDLVGEFQDTGAVAGEDGVAFVGGGAGAVALA